MKKEFKFYLSLLITVVIVSFILFLISQREDVLDIETINKLFYSSFSFVAEKNERTMYLVGLLLGPSIFLLIYTIINKNMPKSNNEDSLDKMYGNFFIAFIAIYLICFLFLKETGNNSYLQLIFKNINEFVIFIFYSLIILYYYLKKKEKTNKILTIIFILISVLFLSLTALIFIKTNFFFAYTSSYASAHHFEAFYYPIYYVYNNLDIGIDFTNLYGLYPYFLLPILKILGGISVLKVTTICTTILVIVLTSLLIFFFKYIKNKMISFLAFLTMLMYEVNGLFIFKGSYYYQYGLHRTLFPILIFIIIYRILTTTGKKQKYLKIFGYIISGMALLYNIDSGVVTVVTYILFNLYQNALDYSFKDKRIYIESLKNIGYTLLSCAFFLILIKIVIYLSSGIVIQYTNMLYGQTVFYKLGFYMIKMNLFHPWMLLVFIYLCCLTYPITKFKCFNQTMTKEERIRNSLLFTISLIGLGIFSYYQGRSHREVFFAVVWPLIIIMAIILDNIRLNKDKYYSFNVHLKEALIIIIFATYSSILSYNLLLNKNVRTIYQINPPKNIIMYNIDYIEKEYNYLKEQYGKVNLLLDYTAQYYTYLNITDIPKLDNPIDWIYNKENIDTTINYMISIDVFLTMRYNADLMNTVNKNFDLEENTLVRKRYKDLNSPTAYDNYIIYTPLKNN